MEKLHLSEGMAAQGHGYPHPKGTAVPSALLRLAQSIRAPRDEVSACPRHVLNVFLLALWHSVDWCRPEKTRSRPGSCCPWMRSAGRAARLGAIPLLQPRSPAARAAAGEAPRAGIRRPGMLGCREWRRAANLPPKPQSPEHHSLSLCHLY